MKYVPALLALALTAWLAACGGSIRLPPVAPEEVEIYMPGQIPSEQYEVMGEIRLNRPLQTPDQEIIEEARQRAAERYGADAMIITSIRTTAEGGIDMNLQQEHQKILVAQPVYYPSRHPELEEEQG